MAQTGEDKVKKDIKKILEEWGVFYHMSVMTGYGNSGFPDFVICLDGFFLTIEAKEDAYDHRNRLITTRGKDIGKIVKKGGPTELQRTSMVNIRDSGGMTFCVDKYNVSNLYSFIDWFLNFEFELPLDGIEFNFCEHVKQKAVELDLWYDIKPSE